MNQIAHIVNGQVATMSSLEISELTGKEHKNVIRDIRVMLEELRNDGSDLSHVREEKDARGYTTMFHLTRELTDVLLTGYSIPLRRKVIARWHELEARVSAAPDLTTDEGRLLMIQDLAAKQLILLSDNKRISAERDHAIATKAQISDRKTATAMATAAAKAREVNRLKHELGYSQRHATILQVEKKLKRDFDFHPLRRWCNQNHVKPDTVPDKRYPDGVKAWPAAAWQDCYGVDLGSLFAEAK